jgi:hypothetical protein
MASFNLQEYDQVHDRLPKFWTDHANGRINTELVFHDERRFIVRAEIYFDKEDINPTATGYAEEIVGVGMVNKTSALENCETSSIGRALANCGYAGIKRPSLEEMQKVERYQAEPRKLPKSKEPKVYTPEQITQVKMALGLIPVLQDVNEARKLWEENKELLEVPVDGTTLKDALNARVEVIR